MSFNYDDYRELEATFNSKYGVSFRYEEFEESILKNKLLAKHFYRKSTDGIEEGSYVGKFSVLFKQALDSYVKREINTLNINDMLTDYKNLMDGYKKASEEGGEIIPEWPDDKKLINRVKRDLRNVPETKEAYIIEKYNNRTLRLRDMRAHAQSLVGSKDPDKLAIVFAYSKALEEINAKRPGWWRIIHPFRNNAEQREAKDFKKLVTSELGFYDTAAQETDEYKEHIRKSGERPQIQFTEGFKRARAIAYDNSILDVKESVNTLSENLNVQAPEVIEDDRRSISLPDFDEVNNEEVSIEIRDSKDLEKVLNNSVNSL